VTSVARRHGADVIDLPTNVGFAAGVNVLASAVKTAWLVVANADVLFDEGEDHALATAERRGWDVVCPAHVDARGRRSHSLRAIPTPGRFLLEWVLLPDRPMPMPFRGRVQKWRLPEMDETVQAATAAVLLVRTELLREVPMPEQYFLYWEEMDWFWELRQRGAGVGYDPAWRVERHGGRTELGTRKAFLMGRNAVTLGRRRYGPAGAAVYRILVAAWLLRLAAGDTLARNRRERWRARRSAFAGAFGLRSAP
jgi:GT2 family glycosyltransferase